MWNANDLNVAKERIEDIRRTAEKHNAVARMKAAGQDKQTGEQSGKQSGNKPRKFWQQVRNALR